MRPERRIAPRRHGEAPKAKRSVLRLPQDAAARQLYRQLPRDLGQLASDQREFHLLGWRRYERPHPKRRKLTRYRDRHPLHDRARDFSVRGPASRWLRDWRHVACRETHDRTGAIAALIAMSAGALSLGLKGAQLLGAPPSTRSSRGRRGRPQRRASLGLSLLVCGVGLLAIIAGCDAAARRIAQRARTHGRRASPLAASSSPAMPRLPNP